MADTQLQLSKTMQLSKNDGIPNVAEGLTEPAASGINTIDAEGDYDMWCIEDRGIYKIGGGGLEHV